MPSPTQCISHGIWWNMMEFDGIWWNMMEYVCFYFTDAPVQLEVFHPEINHLLERNSYQPRAIHRSGKIIRITFSLSKPFIKISFSLGNGDVCVCVCVCNPDIIVNYPETRALLQFRWVFPRSWERVLRVEPVSTTLNNNAAITISDWVISHATPNK